MSIEEQKDQVFAILDEMREPMIQALQEFVRIPSVAENGEKPYPYGENVARMLETCLALAEEKGLMARNVDGQMGVMDFDEKEPYLGFLCHLDVVPAGDGWSVPPYQGVIRQGKLYGRGATDNKGAAVSVLFAMEAIRRAGIRLSKGVRFLAGTNEERGSSDLRYYREKEKLPEVVITPDGMYPLINVEKGRLKVRLEMPVDDPDGMLLEISGAEAVNIVPAKAYAKVRGVAVPVIRSAVSRCPEGLEYQIRELEEGIVSITINGKGAHAATPEQGKNALTALYLLLSSIPLKGVSQVMSRLSHIFPYGEYHGESSGVFCEDSISGTITLVNSMMFYQDGVLFTDLDIRFPVSRTCQEMKERLQEKCEQYGIHLAEVEESEGHYTDANLPYVQTLLRIFEEHTGKPGIPISMGGGTYVHDVEGGVAFGILMPGEEPVPTHGADEYIILDHLVLNAKMFAQVIMELCQ